MHEDGAAACREDGDVCAAIAHVVKGALTETLADGIELAGALAIHAFFTGNEIIEDPDVIKDAAGNVHGCGRGKYSALAALTGCLDVVDDALAVRERGWIYVKELRDSMLKATAAFGKG